MAKGSIPASWGNVAWGMDESLRRATRALSPASFMVDVAVGRGTRVPEVGALRDAVMDTIKERAEE